MKSKFFWTGDLILQAKRNLIGGNKQVGRHPFTLYLCGTQNYRNDINWLGLLFNTKITKNLNSYKESYSGEKFFTVLGVTQQGKANG